MFVNNFSFFSYLILLPFAFAETLLKDSNITQTKISFGSCANFIKSPDIDIFPSIMQFNPELFIWLGDFAYVDDKILFIKSVLPDLSIVETRFNSTKYHPSHMKMKSSIPTIGIWDDHDYGQNDGNKYNPHKYKIQQMFLDAIDEPKNSHRRFMDDGIYFSKTISQNIKIILLDVRFNKDSWFEESMDMLGIKQWKWLENEINDPLIEIFFIVSGTQIMPDDRFLPESWYVPSKEKLYSLVKKYKKRVVLISGDVHYGEIMQHPCSCHQLIEITSSGMTHYFGDGKIIKSNLANFLFPNTFNTPNDRFFHYNFGAIEILFDKNNMSNSKVILQIRDINNQIRLEKILLFKDLEISECEIKECRLDSPRIFRFLANAFVKIVNFDLYIYSFIIICLMILVFIFFSISYIARKIGKKLKNINKNKSE